VWARVINETAGVMGEVVVDEEEGAEAGAPVQEEKEEEDGDDDFFGEVAVAAERRGRAPADNLTAVQTQQRNNRTAAEEVGLYRKEPSILMKADPLQWWKDNEPRFPNLAKLARRVLAIPATSASSERIFSVSGNINSKKRARLDPEIVQDLTYLQGSWEAASEEARKRAKVD
jgi:hypothetical protein